MIYTPKQRALMELWRTNKLKRINLLEGSVSSGKTWISLVIWAFWVRTMPSDPKCLYLMSARSLDSLKRNCLILLQDLVGENNFTYSISAKEGRLFGRHIVLEGANDVKAEKKIRGNTYQGAYCDEATTMPEDFFGMILSRLRMKGAKLFATTNPDKPTHWLKEKYIDRSEQLDFLDVKFLLDDNPFLPQEYVENIKKEYNGVFYDRYILGRWVKAEGLVYSNFDNVVPNVDREYSEYVVSIDFGTLNPTVFLLFGKSGKSWYLIKEFYHSGRDTNSQRSVSQYYADLEGFCAGFPVDEVIIDPSAHPFIVEIVQNERFSVRNANNQVINGIRFTYNCLQNGRIWVNDCCKETIKEFGLYSWDEKANIDTVIKENDHAMDALRYFVMTKRIYEDDDYIPLLR